jgi:hypothetical protein
MGCSTRLCDVRSPVGARYLPEENHTLPPPSSANLLYLAVPDHEIRNTVHVQAIAQQLNNREIFHNLASTEVAQQKATLVISFVRL